VSEELVLRQDVTLPGTSLYTQKELLTVTTEKETKQSVASRVRNRPHSVKFRVSSRARMNLECKEDSSQCCNYLSGMAVRILKRYSDRPRVGRPGFCSLQRQDRFWGLTSLLSMLSGNPSARGDFTKDV
jgi:hypothetical protein